MLVPAAFTIFKKLLSPGWSTPLEAESPEGLTFHTIALPSAGMQVTIGSVSVRLNDPTAEQHCAVAMAETACASGCSCIVCTRRLDTCNATDHTRTPRSHPRRHVRRSLPSTSSIMEVLYPSSYLGTPPTPPKPPSYVQRDTYPSTGTTRVNHGKRTERTPLISSTTTTVGTLVSSGHHDPLFEAPSLTGVPSPGDPPGNVPPGEPTASIVGLGIDVSEVAEPLPAYSRFDESQSRTPVASDVLGPYPHISILNQPE